MNAGLSGLLLSFGQRVESGPLATYTAKLWSVGWLKLLVTLYTGPLIRVRRSSDNAEMDVYPVSSSSNAALDSTAMLTWSGSDSVYVKTLYDQSGLGNHWSQTTTTKQPRIVNAGSYDANLVFDGTDDVLLTVNNGSTSNAKSMFYRMQARGLSPASTPFGYNTLNVAVAGQGAFYSGTQTGTDRDVLYVSQPSGAYNTAIWTTVVYPAGSVMLPSVGAAGVVINRSAGVAVRANGTKLYSSSGLLAQSFNTGVDGFTGNFTAGKWAIGGIENSSSPSPINCFGFVVFDADDMSADAATICGLL